jgi:hypothetical protein
MKLIKLLMLMLMQSLLAFSQQNTADSITVAIAPEYNEVGKNYRFFLGENYRTLWATPVKMRVLDIRKEKGGLSIAKLGGGNQTRSIRFVDPTGKEWVLRTIQKYPERGLPENLRPTIAKKIVQDQVSTGHPFAALVVPSLAKALQIPHARPEIVYVGDDPGLMEYRKEFANAAYLFEEREPVGMEDTDNTEKVQRKLQEDNDERSNQQLTLRARLLDFVLGDWDRHEDNWRWLPLEDKVGTYYQPIPRDRDKVFYKTSGVLPWVLSHQWLKSNLQPYGPEIRDVKGWNFNNRYFDRYFLNQLSKDDWLAEIKYVQQHLTPERVEEALHLMPAEVVDLGLDDLRQAMNGRINNLQNSAIEYYQFLAKTVEIPLADKREQVELRYMPAGRLSLIIRNIKKDGAIGRKLYEREFEEGRTSEIRIYGFGGNDVFQVKGNTPANIKVRIIGGAGEDEVQVAPEVVNKGKLFYYDRLDENNLVERSTVKMRLSKDSTVNQYDKRSFVYDRFGPQFKVDYSMDQGFRVGAGLLYEKQGFRRSPYAVKHNFWATYTTGRQSFALNYAGDFKQAVGLYDLRIDANLLGPKNLSSFFGLGNETVFVNEDDKEMPYYRNRYDYLTAEVKLARALSSTWQLQGGISTEFYTSKAGNNENRFLSDYDALNPGEQVFADRTYIGLVANFIYDQRDQVVIPKKGMYWRTALSFNQEVNRHHDNYGKIQTEFRHYVNPGKAGLVIANRIGGGVTIGEPTFFQRMQLGGVNNLRGFHTSRFTGKAMAFHNLDLRLKLFDFTSYIVPGSVGLLAFNDIGRVWEPGENSDTWHDGYGGGLYVVPAELLLIQAAVGVSKEGSLPYISIGFNF